MLTRKQRDLLLYIRDYMGEHSVAPSFDEMRIALGLQSKSGIHRLVTALVERGFLIRLPNKARAIELKRLPEELQNNSKAQSVSNDDSAEIPLWGKIAAGTPIEALRGHDEMLSVPPHLLGRGEHYALTIEGDSMTGAGILDGDTVVIERSNTASNGAIVVALVDDSEATLKRFYHAGNQIILKAENPSYPERTLPSAQVRVQGVLKGLIRDY